MAKDEKGFVNSRGFREGLDQMPKNIYIANDDLTNIILFKSP